MLRAPPVRTAEVRAGLGLGMGTCVLGGQGLEWAQLETYSSNSDLPKEGASETYRLEKALP